MISKSNLRLVLASTAAILAIGVLLAARPLAWMALRQVLRWKFPEVRRISTRNLATSLQDGSHSALLLLDARTPSEYALSHLPNAQRVDFDSDPSRQLGGIAKDRSIVVYCSVGYRSAIFAGKLQAAGFRDVRNLEGSIFEWINENRPLADGAVKVHPYNRAWGWLVKPSARGSGTPGESPPAPIPPRAAAQ